MPQGESQRRIRSRRRTPQINSWWEDKDSDGKVVGYTHILSTLKIPASEKPKKDPVYPREG